MSLCRGTVQWFIPSSRCRLWNLFQIHNCNVLQWDCKWFAVILMWHSQMVEAVSKQMFIILLAKPRQVLHISIASLCIRSTLRTTLKTHRQRAVHRNLCHIFKIRCNFCFLKVKLFCTSVTASIKISDKVKQWNSYICMFVCFHSPDTCRHAGFVIGRLPCSSRTSWLVSVVWWGKSSLCGGLGFYLTVIFTWVCVKLTSKWMNEIKIMHTVNSNDGSGEEWFIHLTKGAAWGLLTACYSRGLHSVTLILDTLVTFMHVLLYQK